MNNSSYATNSSIDLPAAQNDVARKFNTPSYEIASPPQDALRTNIHDGVSTALKDDDRFRSIIAQLDKSY